MPENIPTSHLGLYRAGFTGNQHRRSITVGREAMLHDVIEILRSGIGRKPRHHFLFIGPRGIGKTHLLSLIEDEVNEQSDLNRAYHVVRFPEESHRLLSFSDFLLIVCELLRDALPEEQQWAELYQRLSTEERDELIVDTLVPAIRQRHRERQQSLIIMLENLDQIFEQQLRNTRHVASLRRFFLEDNGCLLVATAQLHFGGIADHKQPFYDFFDVQLLDQLSEDQTVELIRRNLQWERREGLLNDFENLKPKLLALYRMTGGSPRLTLMLYELIAHDAVTEVKVQFQTLLDRITPFYQDRMRDLSPQERALLDTIATMRDQEKTPASIAARMRMKPAHVSVILQRLQKSQYLKSAISHRDKRSRLYAIREGFFDIWLAMNLTRSARQRMPFLVDFFAGFYPSIEARNRKRDEYRQHLTHGEFAELPATPKRSDILEGLDYLSEVGTEAERAAEKLRLASLHACAGNRSQAEIYLNEARMLPLDGMGQWIVANTGLELDLDYLQNIEDLITCWESFRSGNLEAFADRMKATGTSLTFRGWSETRVSFLRDHLKLLPSPRDRIEVRLHLGSFLRTLARWSEAERELETAVTEAIVVGENDLLSQAFTCKSLLLRDTNRLSEAEPLIRRALAIDESSYGMEHPAVARDLNNLAQLLVDTNRLAEAEPLMRRALAISESNYGPDHPVVASLLNNLTRLLGVSNRFSEAEPLVRQALEIDESIDGPMHPKVARSLNNLAQLLKATNRLAEAEPLMRRALAIDESCFGPEHPEVARDLNNLAMLLRETNRPSEAEPLIRRALEIDESSYGPEHPNVAIRLNNLAQLLVDTSRLSEAEPLMRRALLIDESSYGPDHPNVAVRLNNLAQLLQATQRLSEAELLLRRALFINESSRGPSQPPVAICLSNLAQLLKATNRLSEAEPLIRRALLIDESSYGPEHPNVAIRLNNLGQLYQDTNRFGEAEPLMRRALSIDESSYGGDHPTVARDLNNLALLLLVTNRLVEAEPLMRRALMIFVRFQNGTGYEHPSLQLVINNYTAMLRSMGRTEIQIAHEREAIAAEALRSN